ncbi:peptidoglycan-binding protein [Aquabacter sp. CN5-332]|uniref:peptidoglycan-binding protein n=1 Tax=Aquabacter sp. CN5-332 TaxID=3156608 RepID=UPI0032B5621C
MIRAIDVVRRIAPKALSNYVQAFEQGDRHFEKYEVTTPLRLAHFLGQTPHETGGFTILRESGAYSAARILEIFGVGEHSAAVTAAEAKRLAGDGPALFERVYGLGNPRKATELGNARSGDGWMYRGNGGMQTTGRGNHRAMGKLCGLGDLFELSPEAVTAPEYALLPALAEWKQSGCNELADKNDIRTITRRINGGYNGYDDRVAWFNKAWKILGAEAAPWKVADNDNDVADLQAALNVLGYGLMVDGRFGPRSENAVRDFQKRSGLKVDGIAGPATWAVLELRIGAVKAPRAA